MIRLSQVRGQRVLARADAQLVGSVRRLLVDPAGMKVDAAELEGVSEEATILPWEQVVSVGPDALMVEQAGVLQPPSEDVTERIAGGVYDLEGKKVLTDEGDSLGQLEDVEFDEHSGRITGLRVPGHSLAVNRLVALGRDALIVPAAR